ncbi:MAG: hypothetical protein QNJ72_24390 [Pleurocapsa sp. MO_226.B13]|nr:hypothetical protein [Pleurocapsa sp. MO_226.B13]
MTNISIQTLESLISISADEDNFYVLASTIQSLYTSLREQPSPRCEDNYLRMMAHLLENYLNASKQLFLRQQLAKTIARQTKDDHATHYFKQRFAKTEILELLKHHHKLTGRWLVLTHVDYERQKFKVKQV